MAKSKPQPNTAHEAVPPALCAGLLVLATVVVYIPALFAGYIWDDDAYVLNNAHLRSPGGLAEIWFNVRATPQYYPLVHTTYWLEYRLWETTAAGYHLSNVLLHAASSLLLWRVLKVLGVPGAWLAAALFAIHPVQVESVAWITERKNVLSGFFYLGAALCYLRFAFEGRRWNWYLAATLLFVAALLSKTVTASLPAALALALWWKQGRLGRRDWQPLLPLLALGAVLGLLTAWLEREHVGARGPEWDFSFLERCLIASRAAWFYLWKLVFPINLTFIYPRWHIDAAVWWQYTYLIAALALIVSLWLLRRRVGLGPLVAILFFGGTLLPALGFLNVYPMRYSFVADHFQYLACIGPLTLAATGLARLAQHSGRRFHAAVYFLDFIILAALGTLTWVQCFSYMSPEQLWRDTLTRNPRAAIAYLGLGFIFDERGDTDEAEKAYRETITLDPRFWEAYLNLGILLMNTERPEQAIDTLSKAAEIVPTQLDVRNALGEALFRARQHERALETFQTSLQISARQPAVHKKMADILLSDGRIDEALRRLEQALEIDASYQPALELWNALQTQRLKQQ